MEDSELVCSGRRSWSSSGTLKSACNQAKKGSVYFADDAARRVGRGTPDHLVELTADGHKQVAQHRFGDPPAIRRFRLRVHLWVRAYRTDGRWHPGRVPTR